MTLWSQLTAVDVLLSELGAALSLCRVEHLLTHHLSSTPVANDNNADLPPDPVQSVLSHLGPLLASERRSVRLTVYHLINKLVPRLTQHADDVPLVIYVIY